MAGAQKFRQSAVARQNGEVARLKIARGPDVGCTFVLTGANTKIGRGEENDVVLSDLKASRSHAELYRAGGGWALKDLGSSNGIIYRGQALRKFSIGAGETFTLGETTLEFVPAESATQLLTAPPKSVAQIQSERAAREMQEARIKAMTTIRPGIPIGTPKGAVSAKRPINRTVLILGGLVAVYFGMDYLMQTPGVPKPSTENKSGKERDLAAYLPTTVVTEEVKKTADVFYRLGFREFRERNFIRAKKNFETVLQIDAGHALARQYLQNCDLQIKEEVTFHLERGAKDLKSGKLRESRGHYEAILRLLYRDQSSPEFKEATDQLKAVNDKIAEVKS